MLITSFLGRDRGAWRVEVALMLSWRRGRAVALERREENAMPLEAFIRSLSGPSSPQRVPGTAVYLTARRDVVPAALALNLRHNGVLHELVAVMKVVTERSPRVAETERVLAEELPAGLRDVTLRFGFAEKPDVLAALKQHADAVGFDASNASFLAALLARDEREAVAILTKAAGSADGFFAQRAFFLRDQLLDDAEKALKRSRIRSCGPWSVRGASISNSMACIEDASEGQLAQAKEIPGHRANSFRT